MSLIGYSALPQVGEAIHRAVDEEQDFVPLGFDLFGDEPFLGCPVWLGYHMRRWAWSTGRVSVASSVGNKGRMVVVNPSNVTVGGNPTLVIVQGIGIVNKAAAGLISVTGDPADPGGATAPTNGLDSRIAIDTTSVRAVNPPTTRIGNANAVTSGQFVDQFQVAAGANGYSVVLPVRPYVLRPGTLLGIFDETLNETAVFFAWGFNVRCRPEELPESG